MADVKYSNNDISGKSTAADTTANTEIRLSVSDLPKSMILKKKKKGKSSSSRNKFSAI